MILKVKKSKKVNFSWTTSHFIQNTVSYDLIITNLTTQSQQTFSSNLNQTTISLTKAEPILGR